jgi:O-antigen ligase
LVAAALLGIVRFGMRRSLAALVLLGATVGLVPASAAAPTITRVAVTAEGRISVDWSLEPGDETWQVEISRSPSTDE